MREQGGKLGAGCGARLFEMWEHDRGAAFEGDSHAGMVLSEGSPLSSDWGAHEGWLLALLALLNAVKTSGV